MPDRAESDRLAPVIDVDQPHSARMYDYYLGGKDNFAADRETAQKTMGYWRSVEIAVRENRGFLGRAVRHLVAEQGIRQFLDIGTGLPSANNVHEVAQAAAPEARVVYADNDPIVLAHANALLNGTPEGRTGYVRGDLREPESILNDPITREVLDFDRPIALMLVAILHFIIDEDDPRGIIRTLMDALPSGSYLVASHITDEHDPTGILQVQELYHASGVQSQARSRTEFTELVFDGLELVDPGVELVSEWRAEGLGPRPSAAAVSWYGGIARKP
jgi:S-adenosyl methyltransferase